MASLGPEFRRGKNPPASAHRGLCHRRYALIGATIAAGLSAAAAQTLPNAAENAELRKWVPTNCCITNNCCFKVEAREMTPLPGDRYQVVASGQIVRRTDYSRDGHFWRCACDQINGVWVVHPKANTRCVFPPMELY